ncbi:Hypothetical protein, putative [Bodo saltans]|uniref:Uncharacterized protein n=1 Tax=Bodo saltans TaxID=75058 RepID=A0A0S4IT87_BODSA|nr:Hypothetical protein, putative [Bodo saltans]|eukprot:CUF40205.1 Hypothetical protein, putative [Bodo saltans]
MASSMSISGVPVVAVATSAPLQVRSFLNVDETVGWLGDTTSPLSSAGSISPPERSGVLPLSLASTSASPGAGIRRKENASPTGGEPRSPVGALDDTQRNMPIMLDGSMMNAEEQTSLVAVPRMFLNPDDIVAAAPPQQSNPTSRPSRKDAPVILFEPAEASDHPTPNSTTAAMAAGSKNGAKQTSPIKMMLRVTKSKFSCIRHCCPVDNAFFSSKKEFDLWNDVLQNATKELWDGENVSLMLHGAAQNMSLFDLTSQATDPMTVGPSSVSPVSSESAPGAEKEGTSPSSPKSAVSRSQTPDGGGGGAKKKVAPVAGNSKRLSTNGATKPKTRKSTHGAAGGHHHGALENILQALLVEVKHREVPLHYSAHVAVGACILLGNGEISDIAPQVLVVDEPFTQHVEVEQPTASRGGKFGNKLKGGINNNIFFLCVYSAREWGNQRHRATSARRRRTLHATRRS